MWVFSHHKGKMAFLSCRNTVVSGIWPVTTAALFWLCLQRFSSISSLIPVEANGILWASVWYMKNCVICFCRICLFFFSLEPMKTLDCSQQSIASGKTQRDFMILWLVAQTKFNSPPLQPDIRRLKSHVDGKLAGNFV